jgi:hypothetical protein
MLDPVTPEGGGALTWAGVERTNLAMASARRPFDQD